MRASLRAEGRIDSGRIGEVLSSQGVRFNLLDHLEYVRIRLIRALIAFGVASIGAFFFAPHVRNYLVHPQTGLSGLVFLSPAEAFFSDLKLAFALGLVISLPVILYQLWALFAPAMNKQHQRLTLALVPTAYVLFLIGCLFAAMYVLPLALRFFLSFGSDQLHQEIAVGNYINFVIGFILPFGAIFELPVVILVLTRIGVLDPSAIARNRKYVIFAIFVIAAIVTPADAVSQIALAIPLLILFEASLLVARWTAPKKQADSGPDAELNPELDPEADPDAVADTEAAEGSGNDDDGK